MNKSHKLKKYFLVLLLLVAIVFVTEIRLLQVEPWIDKGTQVFVPLFEETFIYTFFASITVLGSKSWIIPFMLVMSVVFLVLYRSLLPTIVFLTSVITSHLMNKGIKLLVQRERPSIDPALDAVGYGFPSGHAMVSIVCYLMVAFFLGRKIHHATWKKLTNILFVMLIFLIGISRYVIHVHFLTDIIVGYMLGYLIYKICCYFYLKYV